MIEKLLPYTGAWGVVALVACALAVLALLQGCRPPARPGAFLVALALVGVAAVCALVNERVWFQMIRIDRTEEVKAVLAERGPQEGLAANLRYAEDAAEDRVEGGITTEAMSGGAATPGKTAPANAVPAWREGGKKLRGGSLAPTNQVEETSALTEATKIEAGEVPVIYMKAEQLGIVRQVERGIRLLIRLLWIAVLLALAWDYATAFNNVRSLRPPFPLSSPWIDAFSPKSRALVIRPGTGRPWEPEPLLARAVLKGENVIYFGQRPIWEGQSTLPRIRLPGLELWRVPVLPRGKEVRLTLPRLGTRTVRIPPLDDLWLPLPVVTLWRVPILRYGEPRLPRGSEFVFDAAWFGRYVPVVIGDAPCREMIEDFADILVERRRSGASAGRTLVIAWDRDDELEKPFLLRLAKLAEEANLSIFVWSRVAANAG